VKDYLDNKIVFLVRGGEINGKFSGACCACHLSGAVWWKSIENVIGGMV